MMKNVTTLLVGLFCFLASLNSASACGTPVALRDLGESDLRAYVKTRLTPLAESILDLNQAKDEIAHALFPDTHENTASSFLQAFLPFVHPELWSNFSTGWTAIFDGYTTAAETTNRLLPAQEAKVTRCFWKILVGYLQEANFEQTPTVFTEQQDHTFLIFSVSKTHMGLLYQDPRSRDLIEPIVRGDATPTPFAKEPPESADQFLDLFFNENRRESLLSEELFADFQKGWYALNQDFSPSHLHQEKKNAEAFYRLLRLLPAEAQHAEIYRRLSLPKILAQLVSVAPELYTKIQRYYASQCIIIGVPLPLPSE